MGSDLLAGALDPVWESLVEEAPPLAVAMRGSRDGIREVRDGVAALGVVAIPDGEEIPGDLQAIPIAFQAALVVVNAENPISEVSTAELAELFGDSGRRVPILWDQAGLEGAWARRAVTRFGVRRGGTDLSLELFRTRVLGGGRLDPDMRMLEGQEGVVEAVAREVSAIGIIPGQPGDARVRALSIRGTDDEFAHAPSVDGIYYGDYPLRLPYYMIFRREEQARMGAVLRALLGDFASNRLEAAGWFPAPENERRDRAFILSLDD